jgi:hypothetical protein
MPSRPEASEQRLAQLKAELKAELAAVDYALPGTINVVANRCGKPSCACHGDPPKLHGPYITWTRKINGKTVTRRLSQEQHERYRRWVDNDRRLKALVKEIEALSLKALERAERAPAKRRRR